MNARETQDLFSAIDAFLCHAGEEAVVGSCRRFWETRTSITRAEIDMLVALAQDPLCVSAIAHRLGRDVESTQELLDALLAIGIIEKSGEHYAPTEATILYCRSLDSNPPGT